MRASYNWLKQLSGLDVALDDMAVRLTAAGIEVEALEHCGRGLDGVVVAEVRGQRPHPSRDKLSLVTLFDGAAEQEVVCGAPNVPAPGGRVPFARLGACLPGNFSISEREIGGVISRGMICSETELGIGAATEGILVLDDDCAAVPGTPVVDALGLADTILELGLTPNRPDALGHVGLARELCLLFDAPFTPPRATAPARTLSLPAAFAANRPESLIPLHGPASVDTGATSADTEARKIPPLSVAVVDTARCPRYGAAIVVGVTVADSPFWLRYRLHTLGLRSVNNVVDATNLVLLEWGHPTHAFDLHSIRRGSIVVRTAKDGETMATLDGVARTFCADDLLICDGDGPVAVAGVMGGANSEISAQTNDVAIECAYFDARSVRRTARRLGVHTDASHRFERGVDPDAVRPVLQRVAALIADLGQGVAVVEALDVREQPLTVRTVVLRPSRVDKLLGCEIPRATVDRVLIGLGCGVEARGDDVVEVGLPSHRPDLAREEDLIEEIGRVHGYDRIPTVIPKVRPSSVGTDPMVSFVRHLRLAAAHAGLHEAINYAFVAPRDLARAAVGIEAIRLSNPLSEERSVMRTSLLPGLLANAVRAQSHQVRRAALFELGRSFLPAAGAPLPEETRKLALLLMGPRPRWIGDGEPFDFYDAKGAVEHIVRAVCPTAPVFRHAAGPAPYFHPRHCAEVVIDGSPVGGVGVLHPDVVDAHDLDVAPVYAELDIQVLLAATTRAGVPQARPLPRFPAVTRDIAMIVDEAHTADTVIAELRAAAEGLVEEVVLFDLYRGDPVPAGQRSLAFRLVYRDPGATLTDKQVEKVHRRVAAAAERAFSAVLR